MKKNLRGKLSLSRETVRGLGEEIRRAGGGTTENTCFETCYCRSARTCDWSQCGCQTAGC